MWKFLLLVPKCLQTLQHKKRSQLPQLALTFPAVLPDMEIFPQIREIHVNDGKFQFGFGEISLEFKFQSEQIYIYMGNFWGFF